MWTCASLLLFNPTEITLQVTFSIFIFYPSIFLPADALDDVLLLITNAIPKICLLSQGYCMHKPKGLQK